ncbi:DNA replication factor Cdt1 [Cephus cinctus]|uniref:DNA replication factor Cdt1 n=1 Tax=Cephus cinctus TaxID=211228 RepID=A0AAJ7FIR7_CEPCN|nr:DNA replication factor Cdt1 [Cephus cinctus]
MSQPSVAAFFNTRKRQAPDDLRSKSKVLILEQEQTNLVSDAEESSEIKRSESSGSPLTITEENTGRATPKLVCSSTNDIESNSLCSERVPRIVIKQNPAVRNIQFDSVKSNTQKTSTMNTRNRSIRSRKHSSQDGQIDIRETFLKISSKTDEAKNVVFEKKGALSPTKKRSATPKKNQPVVTKIVNGTNEPPAAGSITPKKGSLMDRLSKQDMSLSEIKNRINKSGRLAELKASITRIKNCEARLDNLNNKDDIRKPQIKKFERIQLEVPVSPQKSNQSPSKSFLSPTKNIDLPKNASSQRRLLFAPKESTPSPVKSSPTKAPAYQRFQSLSDSGPLALPLPYSYRFLAEVFRCVDTVAAMLFNRKELITFKKLRPGVQEQLRRNFTLDHLAQIKTIYPDAFTFHQEKHRSFGSVSQQEKYELVITPVVEVKSGRNTPDADDVLKSASESSMSPAVLLKRRRKFFNTLLEKVKDEHEKFLLGLEMPMVIKKEKITRWHPEFDVESCKEIERAELPEPPNVDKASSAKDVLEKAKTLFNCNTRMEKALQRLVEARMTSKSTSSPLTLDSITNDVTTQVTEEGVRNVEISVVDTPPATPTTQSSFLSTAFKGIPKALLEKVRAKQAAKALEAMTRTPKAEKEATIYSRLPELAKILRNIFVAEKKGVLTVELVIQKLDNSYRTKLTPNELEEHIRLLCKLLPTWASLHVVRKIDYLKLAKDVDIAKVVKRLEILANDKVKV